MLERVLMKRALRTCLFAIACAVFVQPFWLHRVVVVVVAPVMLLVMVVLSSSFVVGVFLLLSVHGFSRGPEPAITEDNESATPPNKVLSGLTAHCCPMVYSIALSVGFPFCVLRYENIPISHSAIHEHPHLSLSHTRIHIQMTHTLHAPARAPNHTHKPNTHKCIQHPPTNTHRHTEHIHTCIHTHTC